MKEKGVWNPSFFSNCDLSLSDALVCPESQPLPNVSLETHIKLTVLAFQSQTFPESRDPINIDSIYKPGKM